MTSAADRRRRVGWLVATALSLACMSAACGRAAAPQLVELRGPTMGTTWSVKLVARSNGLTAADTQAIDRGIRDLLTEVESALSTWDSGTELSRFNAYRGTQPVAVSREMFELFQSAMTMAADTDGAVDVTVLPLVHAWGFGGRGNERLPPPDAATLVRLRAATGVGQIEMDPAVPSIRKRHPDVECDFSAFAAGYAADRVAALLEGHDLDGFLIDMSGELVARGYGATGAPWQVAVERPEAAPRQATRVVRLVDMAIATSGDYRNYREVGGVRLSHIIDPRTGAPVQHRLASATVLDRSCVRADALATALMVLGPDEGLALARRLDLAALFLVRNEGGGFDERTTPRFDALAGAVQ